jgi:hypothetical protein
VLTPDHRHADIIRSHHALQLRTWEYRISSLISMHEPGWSVPADRHFGQPRATLALPSQSIGGRRLARTVSKGARRVERGLPVERACDGGFRKSRNGWAKAVRAPWALLCRLKRVNTMGGKAVRALWRPAEAPGQRSEAPSPLSPPQGRCAV